MESELYNSSCFGECNGYIGITNVVNGESPYYYEWSNGAMTNSINNLCPGEYSVTVSDFYYCPATASFEITEPDELLLYISTTDESAYQANDGNSNSHY
ncbi:MAG: hypothetical protein R2771_14245 [Saprospiraceae bacterium]